jgi:hypothetical protein
MSKICPLCGGIAKFAGKNWLGEDVLECTVCHEPGNYRRFKDATVFNRITQSEETLAEKLVYHGVTSWNDEFYASTICDEIYKTRAEAIAATLAKLKEICNE